MYFRAFFCIFALVTVANLQAKEEVIQQATRDVKNKRYDHLGKLIKHKLGQGITLSELKALGKKYQAEPLLNAIDATQKIKKYHTSLSLKRKELLQTALFIESSLPKYVKRDTCYLSKKRTGLAYAVEHDPELNTSFIVLSGKSAYIGKGMKKVVHKAIHYRADHPKVVARAVDCTKETREHVLTKKVHGSPGVYQTHGFGKNKQHGKSYRTIYSKLYRPGSMQDAMDKKYRLSTYEKVKVASDILAGLYSLHKQGIVHRDLGARNHFIDIPKGKPGRRNVTACIADLGRATYAVRAADTKVQGNTFYTAPEGLYRKKLKGRDYYKTDVFAVGCVLYRLFYGKKALWQDRSYVNDTEEPLHYRYKSMKYRIKHATKARRTRLQSKRTRLSPKEEFELLVLRMLHTDPSKRGSAKLLSAKASKILSRIK